MTARMMTIAVRGKMTMNEKMQVFEHRQFGIIRTIAIDGAAWFVGNDICEALGYSKPRNALKKYVDGDDALKWGVIDRLGRNQKTTIINESGMYALIFSSSRPEAKAFKHWVTNEILPSIRKYGFYASDDVLERFINNPDMAIGAFSKLKAERDKVKKLETENKRLSADCKYLDTIINCESTVPITVIAKDYGMTGNELNMELKALGIQYKLPSGTWLLFDKYASAGYTKSNTFVYDELHGGCSVHTVWTQLGRKFIYDKLKSIGIVPICERRKNR